MVDGTVMSDISPVLLDTTCGSWDGYVRHKSCIVGLNVCNIVGTVMSDISPVLLDTTCGSWDDYVRHKSCIVGHNVW